MSLKFKKVKAHKSNFGGSRKTSAIKYIVIHYTGNKGDTALNNCKYFQGANRQASAHYFVDGSTYIYKSVPVTSAAWSVGKKYTEGKGGGTLWGKCTNANSLNIEMCNSVKSVPDKTYKQTVELVNYLMKKYSVPASRVVRHFDACNKLCPLPWATKNNERWEKFKKDISGTPATTSTSKKFAEGPYEKTVRVTKECPVRTGRGKACKKLGTLKVGTKVEVLYVLKNAAGNLWGSIDYGNGVGYIYLGNCKEV